MINKKFYRKFDFWLCLLLFVDNIRSAVQIDLASWGWRIDAIIIVLSVVGMITDVFQQDKD